MGPNEGKTFLEKTRYVARALTSYSPFKFEAGVIAVQKLNEYASQHGGTQDKWFKVEYPLGDWYIHDNMSFPTLPEGAEIAETFVIQSNEKGILNKFENAVAYLEGGLQDPSSFSNLVDAIFGTAKLSQADEEAVRGQIQNLAKSLDACRNGFNMLKLTEFHIMLRRYLDKFPLEEPTRATYNLCKVFSQHLAEERQKYCVDAVLFGNIAITTEICENCARVALNQPMKSLRKAATKDVVGDEYLINNQERAFLENFNQLARHLTSSTAIDPHQILELTVKEAIKNGFVDELIKISDNHGKLVYNKKEVALNSATLDECLDMLYEAIPHAIGALNVYSVLCDNAEHIEIKEEKRVRGAKRRLNELFTRIFYSFVHHFLDLDGVLWERRKRRVAEIRRQKGPEAAKKEATKYVEEMLYYPRSLIPSLLDEK